MELLLTNTFVFIPANRCLQYMSEYSSCLLQGYGVLAGPPSRVKAPMVAAHFAIIEWNAPKILPDTVTSYHVYWRKLGSGLEYTVTEKEHQPIVLEGLLAASFYEVYVVAVNAHGKGGSSPRLVFRTRQEVYHFYSDERSYLNNMGLITIKINSFRFCFVVVGLCCLVTMENMFLTYCMCMAACVRVCGVRND